jgi:hypothetical protein
MDGLREIIRDLGQHADSAWHYFRHWSFVCLAAADNHQPILSSHQTKELTNEN